MAPPRSSELTANWGTASIEASGRIPLEAVPPLPVEIPRMGGPATVKASVRGLDPAAIPGAPAGLSGRISLDAQASATRADLAALEGRITFPELQVGVQRPHAGAAGAVDDRHRLGRRHHRAARAIGFRRLPCRHAAPSASRESVPSISTSMAAWTAAALSALTDGVRSEGTAALNLTARGHDDDS